MLATCSTCHCTWPQASSLERSSYKKTQWTTMHGERVSLLLQVSHCTHQIKWRSNIYSILLESSWGEKWSTGWQEEWWRTAAFYRREVSSMDNVLEDTNFYHKIALGPRKAFVKESQTIFSSKIKLFRLCQPVLTPQVQNVLPRATGLGGGVGSKVHSVDGDVN